MSARVQSVRWWVISLVLLSAGSGLVSILLTRSASGGQSHDGIVVEGAGKTLIHGGTGASGGFVPVLTTIAFHAETTGGHVTGSFDCLALAPEANTGSKSGQFTVNVMYVDGQITGATVNGNTATLTGTAPITSTTIQLNNNSTFSGSGVVNVGTFTPSALFGIGLSGRSVNVTNHFTIQGQTDRRSQQQIGAEAARSVATASSRNN